MCGSWGTRLGDIEICEMLETVLATCVQMRLSGLSSLIYYLTLCRLCLHFDRGSAALGGTFDAQTRENCLVQAIHPRPCE